MQKWIQFHTDETNLTLENRLKLLAVSNDIYRDPISLSSKYFRVTYGHIGTVKYFYDSLNVMQSIN